MPKLEMSQDEIRLNGECYIPPQKIDEIIGREEFKQRLLSETTLWIVARSLYENKAKPDNCGWDGLIANQHRFWLTNAKGAVRAAIQAAEEGE